MIIQVWRFVVFPFNSKYTLLAHKHKPALTSSFYRRSERIDLCCCRCCCWYHHHCIGSFGVNTILSLFYVLSVLSLRSFALISQTILKMSSLYMFVCVRVRVQCSCSLFSLLSYTPSTFFSSLSCFISFHHSLLVPFLYTRYERRLGWVFHSNYNRLWMVKPKPEKWERKRGALCVSCTRFIISFRLDFIQFSLWWTIQCRQFIERMRVTKIGERDKSCVTFFREETRRRQLKESTPH